MFKHILVPVDGSAIAQSAVTRAIGLARAFGSRVTVLYVIDPYPFTGVGTDFAYGQAEYLTAAHAEAKLALKQAGDALAAAGVTFGTEVVENHSPWRGVVQKAEALPADLIVMGSHGRSGLEKLVLGSVTQAVLTHTRCSVLVVRE